MTEAATGTPTAAVTPRGVNHLVLNVRDLEESHRFWTEILGFRLVGEYRGRPMRFYSGVDRDDVTHHDLALVEQPSMPEPPPDWSMFDSPLAVNHIAIAYPDRESWLEQVQFLRDRGVRLHTRIDHGMTHSAYLNDPNGYGIEVLYELPEEVWRHDINGALNHAVVLPEDRWMDDDTNYPTSFAQPGDD